MATNSTVRYSAFKSDNCVWYSKCRTKQAFSERKVNISTVGVSVYWTLNSGVPGVLRHFKIEQNRKISTYYFLEIVVFSSTYECLY